MRTRKIDGMLVATFLTTCFYASTYPYIHKQVMSTVSDVWLALNQIVNCLSIILFSSLWKHHGNLLFKSFLKLCFWETALTVGTAIGVSLTRDWLAYYIADTWVFCLVSRNIICGSIRLKTLRYNEEARERFDNDQNIASAAATLIGSVVAIVLDLDMRTMIWVATAGNMLDNIIYSLVYIQTRGNREHGKRQMVVHHTNLKKE